MKCGFLDMRVEDGVVVVDGIPEDDDDGFFTRRVDTFVSGLGSLPLLRRLPLLTLFASVPFRDRLFGIVTATAKGSKSAVGAIKNPSSSINDVVAGTALFFGLLDDDDEVLDVDAFDDG